MDRAALIARLASTRGESDQGANIALAEDLAAAPEAPETALLVALTSDGTAPQRKDAIKVLGTLSALCPARLLPHLDALVGLLGARDNRLIWGAAQAILPLAQLAPDRVRPHIGALLDAEARSTVVTRDHVMRILAVLHHAAPGPETRTPMLDLLAHAPINQLPIYAELSLEALHSPAERAEWARILRLRLEDLMPQSKRRRLEKALRKAG